MGSVDRSFKTLAALTLFVAVSFFWGTSTASYADSLGLYKLLKESEGQPVTIARTQKIQSQLQKNGFVKDTFKYHFGLTPILAYDANVNGGNQEKPLVIGNLTFNTDPNFVAVPSPVIGLEIYNQSRVSFGNGRYISSKISTSYAKATSADHDIKGSNIDLCSINHIRGWLYVNVCGYLGRQEKTHLRSTSKTTNLELKKHFEFFPGIYSNVSVMGRKLVNDLYSQYQWRYSFDSILNQRDRVSLSFTQGEFVEGYLSLNKRYQFSFQTNIISNPVRFDFGLENKTGGKILGVSREDNIQYFGITIPLRRYGTVSIYNIVNESSLSYFSSEAPLIQVNINPITF